MKSRAFSGSTPKPEWDPLWTTIQELDAPVCFHAGSAPSVMFEIRPAYDTAGARAFDNVARRPAAQH